MAGGGGSGAKAGGGAAGGCFEPRWPRTDVDGVLRRVQSWAGLRPAPSQRLPPPHAVRMGRGGPDVVLRPLPVGKGPLPWPWGGLLPGAVPHFLRMGGRQTGAKHPCGSGARKSLKRGVATREPCNQRGDRCPPPGVPSARPALISGRVPGPRAPAPDESPQAPRGAPENPPKKPPFRAKVCRAWRPGAPAGRPPTSPTNRGEAQP